jgi:hypothetical protein
VLSGRLILGSRLSRRQRKELGVSVLITGLLVLAACLIGVFVMLVLALTSFIESGLGR